MKNIANTGRTTEISVIQNGPTLNEINLSNIQIKHFLFPCVRSDNFLSHFIYSTGPV